MLAPITNWSDLRAALQARGEEIYLCAECGSMSIASAKEPPVRCYRRACRAWGTGPKRDKPGRPFQTCPQCGASNPKRPRKACQTAPHAFHG